MKAEVAVTDLERSPGGESFTEMPLIAVVLSGYGNTTKWGGRGNEAFRCPLCCYCTSALKGFRGSFFFFCIDMEANFLLGNEKEGTIGTGVAERTHSVIGTHATIISTRVP